MLTYNITGLIIKNIKTELFKSITNITRNTSLLEIFLTKLHIRDEYEFFGYEPVSNSQGKPIRMTQIKGRYLICASEEGISIYDIRNNMANVKNISHVKDILDIQYLGKGKLAIAPKYQQLGICDLYNSYKLTSLGTDSTVYKPVHIVKYIKNTFLTVFDNHYIITYDYMKGTQVEKFKVCLNPYSVVCLAIGQDNTIYVATTEDVVYIYSDEFKQLAVINEGSSVNNMISFGSKLVITIKDKLKVYSTNTLVLLSSVDVTSITTCLIKLKSKYIVTGDEDGFITFYNIQDNYNSFSRKAYTTAVSNIIQLEDRRLITCSGESFYLKFWK
jgi:hypothetical protein